MSKNKKLSIHARMHAVQLVGQHQLRPADVLVVKSPKMPVIDHYLVYMGSEHGNPKFAANLVDRVQEVTPEYLFSRRDDFYIHRVRYFDGNYYDRREAINRANQWMGKSYQLLRRNCEHFANWVQYSNSFSDQVAKGLIVAGVSTSLTSNRE